MNRNLALLAFSLFTWGIGEGMFIYFQPLYLQQLGADPILIGIIFGLAGVFMAIAQIPAGILVDKIGSLDLLRASWLLGLISTWIMAVSNSMCLFVAGLLIYALTAFVITPMNTYISRVRGKWSVIRALTFISGMFNLGAVTGPIIGGIVSDHLGLRYIYWIAGGIFIFSTVVIFFVERLQVVANENESSIPSVWRNNRYLSFLMISFFIVVAVYLPQPLTPNFLQNVHQLNGTTIGLLGSAGSLGNAVIMLALGNLKPVIGLLLGQMIIGLAVLLFWLGGSPIWFAAGYFCFSGYRLIRSMGIAFVKPLVSERQLGFAFGLTETVNGVAVIFAPFLAGFLYEQNPSNMYIVAFFLISATFIISIIVLPKLYQHGEN